MTELIDLYMQVSMYMNRVADAVELGEQNGESPERIVSNVSAIVADWESDGESDGEDI